MNKTSYEIGHNAEKRVRVALLKAGFKLVIRLRTGFSSRGGFAHKTPADFVAIKEGRFVLIEVKRRAGASVPYSAIEGHQVEALNQCLSLGGLSILATVSDDGEVILHKWGGLNPRESLPTNTQTKMRLT